MDNKAEVKIVGDASGGINAANELTAAWDRASATMRAEFERIGITATESFGAVGTSATLAAEKAVAASSVMATAGARFGGVVESVHASGMRLREGYESVAHGMEFLNKAMLGLVAVLAGGAIFKEIIGDTNKLTQENLKLSKALGITLEQASGVHSELHKFGIETDTVTGAAGKMVRQLKANEAGFNQMGVETRDNQGHFRVLNDIMLDAIGKLGDMKAGVDRTGAAMLFFGRGAGDVTQLLRLNRAEMEEGTRVARELGLVTTQDGVNAMRAYKVHVNELTESFEGMKIAIGKELMPVLSDLAKWFASNGPGIIHWMSDYIKGEQLKAQEIAASNAESWASYQQFVTNLDVALAHGSDAIFKFGYTVKAAMLVVYDALHFDWSSIEADWAAGLNSIASKSHETAQRIKQDAQDAAAAWSASQDARNKLIGTGGPWKGQDTGDSTKGLSAFDPSSLKPQPDGQMDDLKLGHGGKSKKEKAPKDDIVQKMEEELTAKKMAWAMEQDAQNTAHAYSLQSESDYWKSMLARTDLSAKDRGAIQTKYLAAHGQMVKQQVAEVIEGFKAEVEAAGKDAVEKEAIAKRELAFVKNMYGEQSNEYRSALNASLQAKRATEQQLTALTVEGARAAQAALLSVVDAEEAEATSRVTLGVMTHAKLIEQDLQFEARRWQIRRGALEAEQKAILGGPRDPIAVARINNQLLDLDRQYLAKKQALEIQANTASRQRLKTMSDAIGQSWGAAIANMVTMQASFANTIKAMWQGVVSAVVSALTDMIGKWIVQELMGLIIKKTATGAANAMIVTSYAAVAAAAAFASTAAIPVIGPPAAPAAATAAQLAVMAYVPAATFATGAWQLPGDMIAQLHEGEMVVPKTFAEDLRNKGGNGAFGKGDSGLTVNIHATDADSVKRLFMNNKEHVVNAIKAAYRDGKR